MKKVIGAFIAGTAVGCAVTYVYLTKMKQIEYKVIRPSVEEVDNNQNEEETEELYEPRKEDDGWRLINMADEIQINRDPIDYHKISNSAREYDEVEHEIEEIDSTQNEKETMVYEITEREFIEGNADIENTKEVKTLSLWTVDGVLIDEDTETIITDYKNTISEELFNEWKNDPLKDIIYVRNKETGIDYELFKRDQSYAEYQEME